MPKIFLIEGPVGAGKSTFATSLALHVNGVHIALDEWFTRLFSPDRPKEEFLSWYVEHKVRLLEVIWAHSRRILASDTPVVLELGLIQRQGRMDFCKRVTEEGYEMEVHVLDAPREQRRERVLRRNEEKGATFAMVVPEHIFEMASDLWEAPDEYECTEYAIRFAQPGVSPEH